MIPRRVERTPAELLRGVSLLLVEDDSLTREQLARLLSRLVGTVRTARDGSEALQSFRADKPDIVLLDLNMPVLDGMSLAAIIKAESPDTPVIAITAHSEEHVLLKALEVGLDGYICKPVDPDVLMPVIYKNARLAVERQQEGARVQLFTYLLDINPQLIVSCHAGRLDYANRTFLEYCGHEGLEHFLSGQPGSKTELHMDGERYPLNGYAWVAALRGRPEGNRPTACFSAGGEQCQAANTFLVEARRFQDLDRDIVTFTDITHLERERVQLLYRATTDSLTGVANRYKLTDYITSEFIRYRRYKTPLCLIMFDIDHFKAVNDTFGHNVGDDVLSTLAGLAMRTIRETDLMGRWGGEEFLILAPMTELEQAVDLSERLRCVIEETDFPGVGRVTCSFGVAQSRGGENLPGLLERVDAALYMAKHNGRNRVESS